MSRSFFEKFVEQIKTDFPDTAEIMETLYGLTESGQFKQFDERFNEDAPDFKMKQAKDFFISMKYRELLEMIKNNASEPEKKDFFSTLPESVCCRIRFRLSPLGRVRDGGRRDREFAERYGKTVEEVFADFKECWEKYTPYSKEREKGRAFRDGLNAHIDLDKQRRSAINSAENGGMHSEISEHDVGQCYT